MKKRRHPGRARVSSLLLHSDAGHFKGLSDEESVIALGDRTGAASGTNFFKGLFFLDTERVARSIRDEGAVGRYRGNLEPAIPAVLLCSEGVAGDGSEVRGAAPEVAHSSFIAIPIFPRKLGPERGTETHVEQGLVARIYDEVVSSSRRES